MEALGALAVAERHIRALGTARADRGRSDDSARFARRDPTSPFQSAREAVCGAGYRTKNVETACVTYFSWWTERARTARVHLVACAGSILASAVRCGCPSENIPRSDRERAEGFQLTLLSAVAVTLFSASERAEGFHRTITGAVATITGAVAGAVPIRILTLTYRRCHTHRGVHPSTLPVENQSFHVSTSGSPRGRHRAG